jgi:hypothetical protein
MNMVTILMLAVAATSIPSLVPLKGLVVPLEHSGSHVMVQVSIMETKFVPEPCVAWHNGFGQSVTRLDLRGERVFLYSHGMLYGITGSLHYSGAPCDLPYALLSGR